MDGRATDILVYKEDKISYVLTGKNLLSDSTGERELLHLFTQVLGTQIARIEDYGNSNNPEGYAKWGADKFSLMPSVEPYYNSKVVRHKTKLYR